MNRKKEKASEKLYPRDLEWSDSFHIKDGDFFLNSLIHDNIETMLKGSKYSFEDEPQYLEFKLTAQ